MHEESEPEVLPASSPVHNPAGNRIIVLVGMMGAGKSTVGRRLASRLGVKFMDTDTEIEAAAGMSIAEIFEKHGEPAFRRGERKVIERLLQDLHDGENGGGVLATGGGAFMDSQTRDAIALYGVSVWLRADIDLLLKRVMRRNNRPLLKMGDPRDTMLRLRDERYPVYALAEIVVDSVDAPHEEVVDMILTKLTEYFSPPQDQM